MADASLPVYSGAEKRRFARLFKQFVVRIQIQGAFSKDWDMVLIENISKGGLFFRTPTELKPGMVLNFKINIALNKHVISCVGRVVRVRPVGNPVLYEAGVSFTEINESDAALINSTVEEFLAKNPDAKYRA